jgi:hypothetical protein
LHGMPKDDDTRFYPVNGWPVFLNDTTVHAHLYAVI